MAKKLLNYKKTGIFLLLFSGIFAGVFINLPAIAEWSAGKVLTDLHFEKISLSVNKLNPWKTEVRTFTVESEEGNLCVDELDLVHNLQGLASGRINAVSITGLKWAGNPVRFAEKFASSDKDKTETEFQKLQEFLDDPPVQHLRLRTSEISASDEEYKLDGTVSMEGDFHNQLAQFRLDGNFSGLSWLTDLTLVQEDDKIFLGSQMNFPEIDKFPDFLKSLGIEEINELMGSLQEVVQIEEGSSKIRGTAKLSEDGVSDTFFELDASDVSFTAYGLTMDLARALLFITPRSPDSWEVNFYSNLNWGDNFRGEGLNLHFSNEENTFKLTGRAQSLQTGGILPALEVNGLTFEQIKFVRDVEGEVTGLEEVELRFSSIHFEAGLFNLYDGRIVLEWLGEDRFSVRLADAKASMPEMGINLNQIHYEGVISLSELPKISEWQTLEIEEVFIGEDQKLENLQLVVRADAAEHFEISEFSCSVDGSTYELNPANLQIHLPDAESSSYAVEILDGSFGSSEFEDIKISKIRTNLELASLDPIETNGTQSVQFQIEAGEQLFEDGLVRFELLPSGEKVFEEGMLRAFGGKLKLGDFLYDGDLNDLKIKLTADQIIAQSLINCFEDLDAQMDGNFSGYIDLIHLDELGWDFFGGALGVEGDEPGKLKLNLNGMLTNDLNPDSSEYRNMYLLERALMDLTLTGLRVNFKVLEDGERVIEMNVLGQSEVDGKSISIEYRPKIVGGRDALLQKMNLSELGIAP